MTEVLNDTLLLSPHAEKSFDIFNPEHRALIPDVMSRLELWRANALTDLNNTAKIFGRYKSTMVLERDAKFKEKAFTLAIGSYSDRRKDYYLKTELDELHEAAQGIADSGIEKYGKAAIELLKKDRSNAFFHIPSNSGPTLEEWAEEQFIDQVIGYLKYETALAVYKNTEIVKYLIDNDKEHSWERRTYLYGDDQDPDVLIYSVEPLLIIYDSKVATHVKLMLSQ